MELTEKSYKFVRYADDVIILTKTKKDGKKAFEFAKKYLEGKLNLKVNKEKSLISASEFEFLGFKYTQNCSKKIRESTIEKAKNKIRRITDFKKNGYKIEKVIREINQFLGYKLESGNGEDTEKKNKKRKGYYIGKGWIDYFAECTNNLKDYHNILSQMKNMDCFTKYRLRSYKYKKTKWNKKNILPDNEEFYRMGLRSFVETYKIAVKRYCNKNIKIQLKWLSKTYNNYNDNYMNKKISVSRNKVLKCFISI